MNDKLAHLLAGMALAAVAFPFGLAPALLAGLFAGMGKEAWDRLGHGTPDAFDALATAVGGFLMAGWLWLHFTL